MDSLYTVLYWVNWFFIALASAGTLFQLCYILFAFLKPKRFPKSERINRIGVLICARDEEEVIADVVRELREKQSYPKEAYDIYVVADNCSDRTAEEAEKAGAVVLIHQDPDPKTHRVSYALKYGFDYLLKEKPDAYDFFIRFDADNHAKEDYLSKMNDAFNTGVELARPYEASLNPTQNNWSKVSATYYYRDSRLASNFRERANMDSMLTGAGLMVSARLLKKSGGWDAMGMSEDAEFTLQRLFENERVHYVSEAVVYEDQPSSSKDTWSRLVRMGHGLHSLFWRKGFHLLGHFFVSGRWSNVDLFNQLMFIPVAVFCCLWFPAYYIYFIIVHLMNGYLGMSILPMFSAFESQGQLWELSWMIAVVLVLYYFTYAFQTWLACHFSKKDGNLSSLKGLWSGILLSPVFMVFYGLAITVGALSHPQWRKVHRNSCHRDEKA